MSNDNTSNSDMLCPIDPTFWQMCGTRRDQFENIIEPIWSAEKKTEQDWAWTHTELKPDGSSVEKQGVCRWQPVSSEFGKCLKPQSSTVIADDGQQWAWIPKTDGCMEFCRPDSEDSDKTIECNPLYVDETSREFKHDINNPRDPWGACSNHPALQKAVVNKCDDRCSGDDAVIEHCETCIRENIGNLWNPFEECSLIPIGDLTDLCKAPGNSYMQKSGWNYNFVPNTNAYKCGDRCRRKVANYD